MTQLIPMHVQINHDINLLYKIARTIFTKDALEVLLYGSDFEEPTEGDYENIRQFQSLDRKGTRREPSQTLSIETDTPAEGLWYESEYDRIYD